MEVNPKVSVCITTYNHENYIANCLDSIVNQECDFDFEIIIGDDCSTDNTQLIIEEYVSKYPKIIKPIFREKNIGGEKNYLDVHNNILGEYICHVDGDDYLLPGKLKNQVDFMDKTPDCNISFHRIRILSPDGNIKDDLVEYEKVKDGFERKDLLLYMAVATHSSKMYRKDVSSFKIPPFTVSDFYMNVEQLKNQKAYYINNNCYGVYRSGIGQSTNSKENIKDMIYDTLNYFLEKYPKDKKYINVQFLIIFLVELKNKRSSLKYFYGFIKSFCFESIFISINTWPIRKMFKLNG